MRTLSLSLRDTYVYVRVARNKRESRGLLAVINRVEPEVDLTAARAEIIFRGIFREIFFSFFFFSPSFLFIFLPSLFPRLTHAALTRVLGRNQFEISHRARKSIRFTGYP